MDTIIIFCLIVVLTILVFTYLTNSFNEPEAMNTPSSDGSFLNRIKLHTPSAQIKYAIETKDPNAVTVKGEIEVMQEVSESAETLDISPTITFVSAAELAKLAVGEPKPKTTKPRKPRAKLRSCENCANFVPIKKTTRKKVQKDEKETQEKDSQEETVTQPRTPEG